jgi:hypothetical protein
MLIHVTAYKKTKAVSSNCQCEKDLKRQLKAAVSRFTPGIKKFKGSFNLFTTNF